MNGRGGQQSIIIDEKIVRPANKQDQWKYTLTDASVEGAKKTKDQSIEYFTLLSNPLKQNTYPFFVV